VNPQVLDSHHHSSSFGLVSVVVKSPYWGFVDLVQLENSAETCLSLALDDQVVTVPGLRIVHSLDRHCYRDHQLVSSSLVVHVEDVSDSVVPEPSIDSDSLATNDFRHSADASIDLPNPGPF
jgi:hypothetical protein